jgi:uncharacterized circularly permuted ATP-grasp superfamily protein/uncharacterized alpha-E superfamily protein
MSDNADQPKRSDSPAPDENPGSRQQQSSAGDLSGAEWTMNVQPDQAQMQSQGQFQQQRSQLEQQQQQRSASVDSSMSISADARKQTLLSTYVPAHRGYDENLDPKGQPRHHWQRLDQMLSKVGADGMERRWKQIRRTVHQNGIAFSSYGDPADRKRHLQLDPLPQVITHEEWSRIDAALKQRASLLNKILEDLYGERKLISDGVLPPEVLFDHPHYQLPYHDLPLPGQRHLHFYGAELFRSPTGEWWVISDRTDSPGGCGFALENRLAISRTFANEFRRCNVSRLAPYFISVREHLVSLARRNRENPHIAILSAGIGSASYFEDSFLARYLGFTLVEASDLVVRSGRLMLKTLAGLTPIDVIMRRKQGNNLDPLELGGGAPGIAGILQVVREGNLAIASAPGSGLVESPVFMAFMPRICQALFGTDLLLPGVATYWGGEASSLELMLDTIDDLTLLPAFRERTIVGTQVNQRKLIDPQAMTRDERIDLIRNDAAGWVGQERIVRSTAAVWDNGSIRSGYVSMRCFLVAKDDSWHSLPGGLSRVSESASEMVRNPFQGGGTKDVWVVSKDPVEPVSLLKSLGEPVSAQRGGGFLSSRVAENLCWLGRYMERADATARLLRAVAARLTGEVSPADSVELPSLIRALAVEGRIDAGFAIKEISRQLPELDHCLASNTLDRSDPNSLRSLVDQIASLATQVRERLSSDSWRIVQEISDDFDNSDPDQCDLADLLEITSDLVLDLASFNGLVSESMTRTDGFRFLNIGRRLEHSLQIISLIKDCLLQKEQPTSELLEAVLEIADSIMTYRSRYYANLQLPAVLDLLLLDEMNPRSLAFQLVSLNKNLKSLPGNKDQSRFPTEQRLAMDALHTVRMANLNELCNAHANGDQTPLLELLETVEKLLPRVSIAVSNRFLVHSGPFNQMISGTFPERRR